jgi:condensation domain-containing protein
VRLMEFSDYAVEPGRIVQWRMAEKTRAAAEAAPDHDAPPSYNQEIHLRVRLDHRAGNAAPHWIVTTTDIPGAVDVDVLQGVLERFVRRHGTLLSGFRMTDGEIRRFVLDPAVVALERVDGVDCATTDEVRAQLKTTFASLDDPLAWPAYGFGVVVRETASTVFMVSDHTNIDGQSSAVVASDIQQLYAAAVAGREADLPTPANFVDFCATERERVEANPAQVEAAVRYWRDFADACGGVPPTLPLDLGVAPGEALPHEAEQIDLVDETTAAEFARWCKANGGSFFSGLLACVASTARDLGGREDFLGVVPLSTRGDAGWTESVGWFANVVPIRFDASATATFREVMVGAHESLRVAFRHADVPFPRVMRELRDVFQPSRLKIIETLNYQDFTRSARFEALERWKAHLLPGASVGDQVHLFVNRTHHGVYVHARYPDTETARESVHHFLDLTSKAIADIARLPTM